MGWRCGYRRVLVVLLSAPATHKHQGWEGGTKGRLDLGDGDREVPTPVGTATLAVTAASSAALQTQTLSPLS